MAQKESAYKASWEAAMENVEKAGKDLAQKISGEQANQGQASQEEPEQKVVAPKAPPAKK